LSAPYMLSLERQMSGATPKRSLSVFSYARKSVEASTVKQV